MCFIHINVMWRKMDANRVSPSQQYRSCKCDQRLTIFVVLCHKMENSSTYKGRKDFLSHPKTEQNLLTSCGSGTAKKILCHLSASSILNRMISQRREEQFKFETLLAFFKNSHFQSLACARQICFAEFGHSLCRIFQDATGRPLGCRLV